MQRVCRTIGMIVLAVVLAWPGARTGAQDVGAGPYHEIARLGRGMVRSAAWSPDGALAAVGGALGIWLYTADLQDVGLLTGHQKAVYGVAFSPDGTRLASASHDMTVRLWDVAAQQELFTLEGHTGLVVSVAWSPDGQIVASGSYDGTVRLWDAATGSARGVLAGHTDWVNQVAWSADGLSVISSSYDGTLRVWDAAAQQTRDVVEGTPEEWQRLTGQRADSFLGPQAPLAAVSWSADGTRELIADWEAGVQVRDTGGALLAERPEHVDWITGLRWDADALRSASDDGRLEAWDPASGALLGVTEAVLDAGPSEAARPDGQRTAAAGLDGVTIRDEGNGTVLAVLPGPANAAAWSPDGTRLAVALRNGTIKIWGEP